VDTCSGPPTVFSKDALGLRTTSTGGTVEDLKGNDEIRRKYLLI